MIVHPLTSREVKLARRPDETPRPEHFEIVTSPMPRPSAQEILVRNRWFRISISARLMMSAGAEDIKGIPFPPIKPGDTLADGAIGEVVSAPSESGLQPGDFVSHHCGWREYAAVPLNQCVLLPSGPVNPVAYLGHGWTAYAALTRGVQVRQGDTVFVSSGAGAIGSMAGQIARRLGAARVIGSTTSHTKAEWMKTALGYDAVIVIGSTPIAELLADAAPEGIDVYVDIVGGEHLQAAVEVARQGARFVLLGALTAELAAKGATKVAPVELDSFQLIIKGMTLRGYSADNDPDAFNEWLQHLDEWQQDNGIHLTSSKFTGIESAPQALHEACLGRLKGLVYVEL
ncbi:MDR family NADP-dependent oxidoreductase [Solimicrobium silvestre]|uniref:Putative NADP-dependent oxidoreductase n=1 Tax=Solimicrobium silvestre TaxID=2099400 RepID=A0A2S9H2T9_9BURK|nr:NADP-dependent oxidoreductase [Solimicrobium silvestre]PRC94299.1 putative NADP-dependent oxidoreductase [Solimicrobium silvestre]